MYTILKIRVEAQSVHRKTKGPQTQRIKRIFFEFQKSVWGYLPKKSEEV
jgi:hypothetical protein